ncbi:DUF968 domain-containing protein [Bradyrhizobium sp. JYMT SZCCT0428]|nr:DUF968 domain-containing protein [Bradyrhizobium sp. JYMT SZCCT0428]
MLAIQVELLTARERLAFFNGVADATCKAVDQQHRRRPRQSAGGNPEPREVAVSGREPYDPHHLLFAQPRGLGQKVSDEFTIPRCRAHHRELHRASKQRDWWATAGLEPVGLPRQLWLETHPLPMVPPVQGEDGASDKPYKGVQRFQN